MTSPETPSNGFAVILGGVEIQVTYRNGSQERVKVRQLPIRQLREWSELTGDEASLAELYCDKLNREAIAQLRKLRGEELALMQLIQRAGDPQEVEKTSEQLAVVRAGIEKIERENRWDDDLVPESHDEIIRIGEQLNRPRFDRWIKDRQQSIGHLKDLYREYLPEHPLAQTAEKKSAPATSTAPVSPSSLPTPA